MRLLNTSTLQFEEFFNPPRYAILSHHWGESESEVSFEDYINGRKKDSEGYQKIIGCCELAKSRKHGYVWIDTCCIDKRSSAELSEAINSMWEWYSNSAECYALLDTVPSLAQGHATVIRAVRKSPWFWRGWTLQELLAPRTVLLCTSQWEMIGDKSDEVLLHEISSLTNIPTICLTSQFALHATCIAQRLSWAARRRTTRPEDSAYSLLGLVGVNMSLIYGEGSKAFLRLQQEIIKQTDDESIFAWRYVSPPSGLISGVLAPHVDFFAHSGNVRRLDDCRTHPYSITNRGLEFHSDEVHSISSLGVFVIPLMCEDRPPGQPAQRCEIAVRPEQNELYRVGVSRLGGHLDGMFGAHEKESPKPWRLYIRLSRWQHHYQPAISAMVKLIDAWRQRKAERAVVDAQMNTVRAGTKKRHASTTTSPPVGNRYRHHPQPRDGPSYPE